MRRTPLADQLPYRFTPPRLRPFWLWASRFYLGPKLRRPHRIEELDIAGIEAVRPLVQRGDAVLLTPNHPDHADGFVIFELGRRLGTPFYYMSAYQNLRGINHWVLPRIGVFPVDREGADITAFKTGVDVLARGRNPLVIFPEGEVYNLMDRLTPIREGAVAVAAAAVRRLDDPGKTVWIVPVALKYRFLDRADPLPAMLRVMDELERRITWRLQTDRPLVERLFRYAEAMLGLKEFEYLDAAQAGSLRDRVANLARRILERIEDRRLGKRHDDAVPVRVKELRRACLDALSDPATTPDASAALHRDLDDLFFVIQLFSYPGDYIRECPTVERVAETLMKCEQDFLGVDIARPYGPRRALVRLGAPIDVRARLASAGKARQAVAALTAELEGRMQGLLDTIPPGRSLGELTAETR